MLDFSVCGSTRTRFPCRGSGRQSGVGLQPLPSLPEVMSSKQARLLPAHPLRPRRHRQEGTGCAQADGRGSGREAHTFTNTTYRLISLSVHPPRKYVAHGFFLGVPAFFQATPGCRVYTERGLIPPDWQSRECHLAQSKPALRHDWWCQHQLL